MHPSAGWGGAGVDVYSNEKALMYTNICGVFVNAAVPLRDVGRDLSSLTPGQRQSSGSRFCRGEAEKAEVTPDM